MMIRSYVQNQNENCGVSKEMSASQSLHHESNTTDPTYMCCFSINSSILKEFLILCWMHKLFDNKYTVHTNST